MNHDPIMRAQAEAFCMATSPRLGNNSPVQCLPFQTLRDLFEHYLKPEKRDVINFTCANTGVLRITYYSDGNPLPPNIVYVFARNCNSWKMDEGMAGLRFSS